MNYNTWLFLLVFISIYLILGIELNYFPLIPSFLPENEIAKINHVYLSIAYSILAAYIFFYFSVVLPRKVLIHRSKNIIGRQVHWLLYELFVLINQILYSYDIKKGVDGVEEKDLLHINGNVKTKFSGYYSTSEHWRTIGKKGKKFTGFGDQPFTFPDSVIASLKKTPFSIEQIRKSNPNFHVDETLSEILSSIETNQLIEWYATKNSELFIFANSSERIYSLIEDYKRLKKLRYHLRFRNSYNTIYFYKNEDIENMPQKQAELLTSIAPIHGKFNLLRPSLICNSDYENYRAFKSLIRIQDIYTFYYKEKEDLEVPENKCFIILPTGISNRCIKKLIKESSQEKLIILLKPNIFFTSSVEKFKKENIQNGLYKIYYRSPISIFNITIFQNFPTKETIETVNRNIHDLIGNYKQKN